MRAIRRVGCGALAIAAVALGAAPALADDPAPVARPDALQQPVEDGCQRNPVGLLSFTSPEWVYVYANEGFNPNPHKARVAVGNVHSTGTATGDLPQNHAFYDFNTDLIPDSGYEYLLGGDPSVPNGNFADNPAILHVEWETGTLGRFAWATGGDRAKLWGSWVWDCGHWGQGFTADPDDPTGSIINDTDYFLPGTGMAGGLRGEQTEFHPMQSVVITRDRATVPVVGETETDAFLSSLGTTARSESRCSKENPAPSPFAYGPNWTACINDPAKARNNVNDRDYSFFIPAAPKPGPSAVNLRFRVDNRNPQGTGPVENIVPRGVAGVDVTVPFNNFGSDAQLLSYGKSLFVGWDGALQNIPAKVDVVFRQLKILNSLDDPGFSTSAGVPPGEWGMYSDINGSWQFINEYASDLDLVNTGEVVNLNHTYSINVPDGERLRVGMTGRECDLPKIAPCPVTSEVAEDNDGPGDASQSFASVSEAVGTHVLNGGPASSPNWELTYDVNLISPATTQRIGPGGFCPFDTFSPRSRILRKKVKASQRRIRLRGKGKDKNCRKRRGKPRRVEVSVARKVSKRKCRFLERNGGFSKARRCRERSFLKAKGRKRWKFSKRWPGDPGIYLIASRAFDKTGNVEIAKTRGNRLRLKVEG
ncbi:MAG: hypothetical protein AABM29_05235 [Actinomycetota bacterium]